jgi:hypothetical protein
VIFATMWRESQGFAIPFVSGPMYNSTMMTITRCNWCGAEWEYDEFIDICLTCNQIDYLMDLSVPSVTITDINERI